MKFSPLRKLGVLAALFACALARGVDLGTASAPNPVFDEHHYIEASAGDLPVVITAPHGGQLYPDSIPSRTEGVTGTDLDTLELARAIAGELFARTGHRAAMVTGCPPTNAIVSSAA